MISFDRFRKRRRRDIRELGAVEAALRDGHPSSEDPAVQLLQTFALKLRAAAPEPREAFLELLDERFGDGSPGPQLVKISDEEPETGRPRCGGARSRIRVLVADDHLPFRQGLILALESEPGIEVIGEAANGITAMELARQLKPDVMVLDLRMPGLGGAVVLERLRAEMPEIRALVMTTSHSPESLLDAVAAGAAGYLLKGTSGEELRRAVIMTYAGGLVITSELAGHLLREFSGRARGEGPSVRPLLATRELEILRLVADGLTDHEIGEQLYISPGMVHSQLTAIREKLGAGRPRRPWRLWSFGATAGGDDD